MPCVDIYQDIHVTTNKVDFNMEILINITLKQTRRSYVLLYDHFFHEKISKMVRALQYQY